ncbi:MULTISPECIES: hypothetical protein [Corynebacterium]|uniref:hypothetical protein n=1 Tax=Corynebacterium TaxID=1716 RepID=UPI00124D7BCB|nr:MULTISPECIES: hypothetical protein [Corynebacterium]
MTATEFARPLCSSVRMNAKWIDILPMLGLGLVGLTSYFMVPPAQAVMGALLLLVAYAALRNKVVFGAWALGVNHAGRMRLLAGPLILAILTQLPACIIVAGALFAENARWWWNGFIGLALCVLAIYVLEALWFQRAHDRPELARAMEPKVWATRPTLVLMRGCTGLPLPVQLILPPLLVFFVIAQIIALGSQVWEWTEPQPLMGMVALVLSLGGVIVAQEPGSLGTWRSFGLTRKQWFGTCLSAMVLYAFIAAGCSKLLAALISYDTSVMSYPTLALRALAFMLVYLALYTFANPKVAISGIPGTVVLASSGMQIAEFYGIDMALSLVILVVAVVVAVVNIFLRGTQTPIRCGVYR